MLDYKYGYLFVDVFLLFPLWLFLYWRPKVFKKEILLISILSAVAALMAQPLFLLDYWRPEVAFDFGNRPLPILEDLLFGFFIGGIASTIYEEVFGKRFAKRKDRTHHWPLLIIPAIVLIIIIPYIGVFGFGMNSMYTTLALFVSFTAVMLWLRNDLALDVLMSGILIGAVMFVTYFIFLSFFPEAIQRWWLLNNLSGILILGIPIEELLWAFGWGMVVGPMYEFFAGLRFRE